MMSRGSTSIPRTPTSATSSILISSPSTGLTSEFFHVKQEDIEYQLLSPISGSSPMTTGKKISYRDLKLNRSFLKIYIILVELAPTVWKFQKFPATQIFREINIRKFKGPKTAILTNLEAPKISKMAIFDLLQSPKLISRKILETEKC